MTQNNRDRFSEFDISQARWLFAIAIGLLALFVVACGSSEEAVQAPAAPAPTAAPEAAARPEVAVIPITAPEPGSDEEQILGVLETQVRATNDGDYGIYQNTCFAVTKTPTVAHAERFIEELGMLGEGDVGSASPFSARGYNAKNVEVKLLRQPQFGQTKFDIYNGDLFVRATSRSWEKVDDKWYSQSAPCFSF